MSMARSSRLNDEGFTLLELLVGLILLSTISLLTVQSLRSARLALAATERQSAEAVVEAAQRHLRRTISDARIVRLPDSRNDTPLIGADERSLRLVTSYAPAGQYGGLYETALSVQLSSGAATLVETRTLYRPAPRPGAGLPVRPQTHSTLLAGITEVTFRYYGVRDPQRGGEWGPDWPDPNTLPQLVSIDVVFPRGDGRRWPSLVIAPAAGE